MCQKAYSGIASGRQGLGKSGLWPAASTKKEREPGKPALLLFACQRALSPAQPEDLPVHPPRNPSRNPRGRRCPVPRWTWHSFFQPAQASPHHCTDHRKQCILPDGSEQFQKVSESSPLVCARSNEIDPDISLEVTTLISEPNMS